MELMCIKNIKNKEYSSLEIGKIYTCLSEYSFSNKHRWEDDGYKLVTISINDKFEHYPKECFITIKEFRNSQLEIIGI